MAVDVPGYPGLSFTYSYDQNRNVTAQATAGVMARYSFTAGYDNEDRLASWNRQNGRKEKVSGTNGTVVSNGVVAVGVTWRSVAAGGGCFG